MLRLLCAAGLLLLAGAAAPGAPPPGVKTIHLDLHAVAPPSPALRYPLLPELRQQKPGNAVLDYRKASSMVKEVAATLPDKDWAAPLERWRELPLDQFPREQARDYLRPFAAALRLAEEGARREYADWELSDKLRKAGISVLFSDLQEMRQFVAFFAVRTRLALAEGRLNDAARDLQTMFAISHHAGQSPTLIGGLVGIGTFRFAAEQLEALIQHPAAPNCYWSLTDLPRPFVDLRTAFQGERMMVYGTFPGIPTSPIDPLTPLTPEQALLLGQVVARLRFEEPNRFQLPETAYKLRIGIEIQQKHEKAKQALVDAGWPREGVDRMAHLQVAVLHGLLEYERYMDEAIKWNNVPYWQARPALLELETRYGRRPRLAGPDEPALPIAYVFLANSGRIMYARTRVERRIAALRCVEAVRLHAAQHGKLPASLDEIKEVPVPVDPYTGKPFEYTATGDHGELYAAAVAPAIPGRKPDPEQALYYEIVLHR
jgi:hypothetical protein